MEQTQSITLVVLLLVLMIGLLLPEVFKKFRIPLVTPLVLLGAILGPLGLEIIESNEVIEFLGFLGVSFLMLMAGLEMDLKEIRKAEKPISEMAILNGFLPFLVGLVLTRAFGYPWDTSLIVGAIFISSSIGIIIPSLNGLSLVKKKAKRMIIASVVLEDMLSLVVLAIILQSVAPIISLPLPLYLIIVVLAFSFVKLLIPKLANHFLSKRLFKKHEEYEDQVKFVIVVFISVLLLFSILGIHPILAAFLVGALLSESVTHDLIYQKIHTLGYGLFVPVFFFAVGMQMDLKIFYEFDISNIILISLIIGLIATKVVSGYIGGKLAGLSTQDSGVFGVLSTIQLTTALAITYSASSVGLLDTTLTTAVIFLAVITTIFVPPILKIISDT